MKANEVRVGNWINKFSNELIDGVPESRIVTPVKVDANHITLLAMAPKWNAGAYEPIPLTEEILLKAGFVYLSRTNVFIKDWGKNGRIFIKWSNEYNAFCWLFGDCYKKVLDYVHNFQNGYRFHTGEELNIEL